MPFGGTEKYVVHRQVVGAELTKQFVAEQVRAYEPDEFDLAHAERGEVDRDVAGAPGRVMLGAHLPGCQAGLDGNLAGPGIEQPVGVQAEITKNRDPRFWQARQQHLQPRIVRGELGNVKRCHGRASLPEVSPGLPTNSLTGGTNL